MNREDFLQKLQEALSGEVPPDVVRENLRYYNEYVREECRKGRKEQDVLDELGDPRLIAHTIIDTTPGGGSEAFPEYRDVFFFGEQDGFDTAENDGENPGRKWTGTMHYYDLNKWYWKVLAVVVVVLFFAVVLAVVSGLLTLLVPLMPFLLVAMLVLWFMRER